MRHREKNGTLPFTVDADGIHRFRAEDVAKVRISASRRKKQIRDPGEMAAYAFKRFTGGANARDLVTELKITPKKARELFELWMSPDLAPAPPRPVAAVRPRKNQEDAF